MSPKESRSRVGFGRGSVRGTLGSGLFLQVCLSLLSQGNGLYSVYPRGRDCIHWLSSWKQNELILFRPRICILPQPKQKKGFSFLQPSYKSPAFTLFGANWTKLWGQGRAVYWLAWASEPISVAREMELCWLSLIRAHHLGWGQGKSYSNHRVNSGWWQWFPKGNLGAVSHGRGKK